MPRILHIFDLMPFIHAGDVNKYSRLEQTLQIGPTWKTQVTPTGGLSLLFNTLYEVVGTGDVVICADRNPTVKKDMYTQYKANRKHKSSVTVDAAAAEYILDKCGYSIIARAGYEADDIIYTLVNKCHDMYDTIYVYTADSDLYFLVDEKVSIKPSSSRAKEVTIDNYEKVLSKKNARYNSLTMQKILCGDASDNINGLPMGLRKDMAKFFYTDAMLPQLGDYQFVRSWAESLFPQALSQIDLIFPIMLDDITTDFKEPNKYLMRNFGAAIHNKMFNRLGDPDFDVQPYIEDMQSKGIYLEEEPNG